MADSQANFITTNVVTAPSPASSGTSLTITGGYGVNLPAAPFNMVACPAGQAPTITNAEVVRVTNIATDTLTITRAQEGSSARSILVGDQIFMGITAHVFAQYLKFRTATGSRNGQYGKFRIDDYGADPTGVALSDTAWTNCYADAVSSIQGSGANSAGAMIEFGTGLYRFSINTVKISDYRIGLCGQGKQTTQIESSGNSGDIVYVTDTAATGRMAAPCHGFTIYGWTAGNSVNGFHYGDRAGAVLDDIEVWGCQTSGSRNFLFKNDNGATAGCEGTMARISSQQGGVSNVTFDGNNASATGANSFDYAEWRIHGVGQAVGQNHNFVELINQAQLAGVHLEVSGNLSANNTFTGTILAIGNSTSDISQLVSSDVYVTIEGDTSAGTLKDLVIQGNSTFTGGMNACQGSFRALTTSGTFVTGSTTGNVVCSITGNLQGPFFTSVGNLVKWGGWSIFDLYANNLQSSIARGLTKITATNASWPIPATATLLRVTCVGGGAGGGGGGSAGSGAPVTNQVGGCGGAGGATSIQTVSVGANTTLSVTVGAGGGGGTGGAAGTAGSGNAGTNNAVNGGTTTVTGTGISVQAFGGPRGRPGAANSNAQIMPFAPGTVSGSGNNNFSTVTAGGPQCGGAAVNYQQGNGAGDPAGYGGGGGGGGVASSATLGGVGGSAGTLLSGGQDNANVGTAGTPTGTVGGSAAANTAAGGGGGGGGAYNGGTSGAGGNGGTGGSGFVIIEVVG